MREINDGYFHIKETPEVQKIIVIPYSQSFNPDRIALETFKQQHSMEKIGSIRPINTPLIGINKEGNIISPNTPIWYGEGVLIVEPTAYDVPENSRLISDKILKLQEIYEKPIIYFEFVSDMACLPAHMNSDNDTWDTETDCNNNAKPDSSPTLFYVGNGEYQKEFQELTGAEKMKECYLPQLPSDLFIEALHNDSIQRNLVFAASYITDEKYHMQVITSARAIYDALCKVTDKDLNDALLTENIKSHMDTLLSIDSENEQLFNEIISRLTVDKNPQGYV